jgi:hypothetical protein
MKIIINAHEDMQYNTSRKFMPIREYGRSVQNMVDQVLLIEDDEKRQKNAEAIINIMTVLNPGITSIEDYEQKLWDHLIVMSDFKLKINSPYPIPTPEKIAAKPEPLKYPKTKIKWSHLGKTFEKLYERALTEQDEEKKTGFVQTLGLYMKVAYNNWHKENIHDDMIKEELNAMSKGAIQFSTTIKFTDVVDVSTAETVALQKSAQNQGQYPSNRNNRNNRNNNNRNNSSSNNNNRNNNNNNRNNNFKKKSY